MLQEQDFLCPPEIVNRKASAPKLSTFFGKRQVGNITKL
jgi:hypothetical protein